jgi:hypothetical protein
VNINDFLLNTSGKTKPKTKPNKTAYSISEFRLCRKIAYNKKTAFLRQNAQNPKIQRLHEGKIISDVRKGLMGYGNNP